MAFAVKQISVMPSYTTVYINSQEERMLCYLFSILDWKSHLWSHLHRPHSYGLFLHRSHVNQRGCIANPIACLKYLTSELMRRKVNYFHTSIPILKSAVWAYQWCDKFTPHWWKIALSKFRSSVFQFQTHYVKTCDLPYEMYLHWAYVNSAKQKYSNSYACTIPRLILHCFITAVRH